MLELFCAYMEHGSGRPSTRTSPAPRMKCTGGGGSRPRRLNYPDPDGEGHTFGLVGYFLFVDNAPLPFPDAS